MRLTAPGRVVFDHSRRIGGTYAEMLRRLDEARGEVTGELVGGDQPRSGAESEADEEEDEDRREPEPPSDPVGSDPGSDDEGEGSEGLHKDRLFGSESDKRFKRGSPGRSWLLGRCPG